MKNKHLLALAACLCCMFVSAAVLAETEETDRGPVADVAAPHHTFPLIVDGAAVVHDFIMKNPGASILEIAKIKTA